jgi:methylenetetrahydrofolate--tRNA-(uracil-5-)-methyltransferase
MNACWGLLPPLPERVRDKKEKGAKMARRALDALDALLAREVLGPRALAYP